jgi:hypothetical protein
VISHGDGFSILVIEGVAANEPPVLPRESMGHEETLLPVAGDSHIPPVDRDATLGHVGVHFLDDLLGC